MCVCVHAYVYIHIQRPKKGTGILSLLPPTYFFFKTGILTESKALFFFWPGGLAGYVLESACLCCPVWQLRAYVAMPRSFMGAENSGPLVLISSTFTH